MLFPRKQKQMQKKHQHRVKQELFQVQICLLSGIWQEPMRRVGQFMSHFPMMVSQGKRMALRSMDRW